MTSVPRGPGRPLERALFLCLASAPLALAAGTARAQDASPQDVQDDQEIVVTAPGLRGSVEGPIAPEIAVDANAITAMGSSTLADVIAQLAPQTGGTQGRPGGGSVVLLNGRRISSIGEVRNLPPEAVARVEVLPEEAAIRFGYAAHQKVINVVLLPSFAFETGELEDRVTDATARNDFNTEMNLVRIAGDNRITANLQYQIGDDVTEAQRGIAGATPLRTLVPLTRQFTVDGVYARALGGGMGVTGNASYDHLNSRALLGAMQSDHSRALARVTTTDTGHAGGVLNGTLSGWTWSLTSNGDHVATTIRTGADGATPARISRGVDDLLGLDAVASGALFRMPAGKANLSVQAGASGERLSARDEDGVGRRLTRRMFSGQLALDLPLLSDRSPVGEVSAGINMALHDYSDASAPLDHGWNVSWTPREPLSVLIAGSREGALPTIRQLGDPVTATPDVRFYDYGTAQTVTAARLDGGDPTLRHDVRSLFKLEATLKPNKRWSMIATYTDATTRDAILMFPGISSALESAFPDRVQRDGTGTIVSVDARPINIAREVRRDLRFGINFSKSWSGAAGPKLPGGGSFGGNHYFGSGSTTLQFAVYDTWHLVDRVELAAGQAPIDLVAGNRLGEGLRVARHALDAQLSATHHGFGIRASASWLGKTRVAPGLPGELSFNAPVTAGVRLFFFPEQQPALKRAMPWLQGFRLLLAVDNVFGSAADVRDRFGAVPIAYQRGYLDPLGRAYRLSIRKTWQ